MSWYRAWELRRVIALLGKGTNQNYMNLTRGKRAGNEVRNIHIQEKQDDVSKIVPENAHAYAKLLNTTMISLLNPHFYSKYSENNYPHEGI